ncbi:MAG: DUF5320 domain-containing protein [Candidatus Izemoplasmatales bacterium]|nr:DUF5320 domain-containing protein [Candidatus Izemoplasmatales bacterium]
MPRRDGTGPQGFGTMTGRKMGNCNRGFGYGRYQSTIKETKDDLLREKELLEQRIKNIDRQLKDE